MLKLFRALFGKQPPAQEPAAPPPILEDEKLVPHRRSCWVPKVESGDGGPFGWASH